MASSTQVAFQLDDESLARVDALVGGEFPSRAGVIRAAVREWLAQRREREIDARLAEGYGATPDDGQAGLWAEVSVDGLAASRLDW